MKRRFAGVQLLVPSDRKPRQPPLAGGTLSSIFRLNASLFQYLSQVAVRVDLCAKAKLCKAGSHALGF